MCEAHRRSNPSRMLMHASRSTSARACAVQRSHKTPTAPTLVARSHSSVAENASSLSLDTSSFHAMSDSSFSSTALSRSFFSALLSARARFNRSLRASIDFSASIERVERRDFVSDSVSSGPCLEPNDFAENAGHASSTLISLSSSNVMSLRWYKVSTNCAASWGSRRMAPLW